MLHLGPRLPGWGSRRGAGKELGICVGWQRKQRGDGENDDSLVHGFPPFGARPIKSQPRSEGDTSAMVEADRGAAYALGQNVGNALREACLGYGQGGFGRK